jgi:hypothetical protein
MEREEAATRKQRATAWCLLAASTLAGILSAYYLLFSIWMTAHPLYDSAAWRLRVYERFGITTLDALLWIGSLVWLRKLAARRQTSA